MIYKKTILIYECDTCGAQDEHPKDWWYVDDPSGPIHWCWGCATVAFGRSVENPDEPWVSKMQAVIA